MAPHRRAGRERTRDQVGGQGSEPKGRADGAVRGALRRLGGMPPRRPGERVRRPGSAARLPLRRAQRNRHGLHARPRRRQEEPAAQGGLPLPRLLTQQQLPQQRPAAGRDGGPGLGPDDGRRQPPPPSPHTPAHAPPARAQSPEPEAIRPAPERRVGAVRRVGIVRLLGARDRVRGPGRHVRLPLRRAGRV